MIFRFLFSPVKYYTETERLTEFGLQAIRTGGRTEIGGRDDLISFLYKEKHLWSSENSIMMTESEEVSILD